MIYYMKRYQNLSKSFLWLSVKLCSMFCISFCMNCSVDVFVWVCFSSQKIEDRNEKRHFAVWLQHQTIIIEVVCSCSLLSVGSTKLGAVCFYKQFQEICLCYLVLKNRIILWFKHDWISTSGFAYYQTK